MIISIISLSSKQIGDAVDRAKKIGDNIEKGIGHSEHPHILRECLFTSSLGIFGYLKYFCSFLIMATAGDSQLLGVMGMFHEGASSEINETMGHT